jgi:hypothetical protein
MLISHPAIQPSLTRTFATPSQDKSASPGQSSNVSNPQSGSAEGQEINQSRATDSRSSPDSASVQTPVSNPEESGLGGQEEQTESQDKMKRDPSEPDSKKREEVLKFGQNKKLDAADD